MNTNTDNKPIEDSIIKELDWSETNQLASNYPITQQYTYITIKHSKCQTQLKNTKQTYPTNQ